MPAEERDHGSLQRPVHGVDRAENVALAKPPRRPQRRRPEVGREIEQGVLVRRADRAIGEFLVEPEARRDDEVGPRVHVREEGLVDLEDVGIDSTQRELAAHDALLEQRDHRLRVDAR